MTTNNGEPSTSRPPIAEYSDGSNSEMGSVSSVDTLTTSSSQIAPLKLPPPPTPSKVPKLSEQPKTEMQLLRAQLISIKKHPTVQKAIKKLPAQL